jgi:hypothetical protein
VSGLRDKSKLTVVSDPAQSLTARYSVKPPTPRPQLIPANALASQTAMGYYGQAGKGRQISPSYASDSTNNPQGHISRLQPVAISTPSGLNQIPDTALGKQSGVD